MGFQQERVKVFLKNADTTSKMSNCWDLKGCPASHYLSCPAYQGKTSCWEDRKGCLCNLYSSCEACPVFVKHLNEMVKI